MNIAARRATTGRPKLGFPSGSSAWAPSAALSVDAYVHLHDAGFYDSVKTSLISQGTLFRIQAAVAIALGITLLARPRRVS